MSKTSKTGIDPNILSALVPFEEHAAETGFFSDLDGTLSRIASTPGEAGVSPAACRSLRDMARRFAVVGVVTGRDVEDAHRMLGCADLLYIGSHGLEWLVDGEVRVLPGAEAYRDTGARVAAELSKVLADPGLLIEKKRLGVAAHYRNAASKREARARISTAVAPLLGKYHLKRVDGRRVIELVPNLALDKGSAIELAIEMTGIRRAVFLGDDVTDIAAFKALAKLREDGLPTLCIAVLSSEAPPGLGRAADLTLHGVSQVERLVAHLAG